MQIDNALVVDSIKLIADHFRANIANRYTMRAITNFLPNDVGSHSLLAIFTERVEDYNLHGLHVDDLYLSLLSAAKLVQTLRSQVLPNIRALVYSDGTIAQAVGTDKVLRDMAISNFSSNLKVYSDKLAELYVLIEAYDISNSGKNRPVKHRFPELANLKEYLM